MFKTCQTVNCGAKDVALKSNWAACTQVAGRNKNSESREIERMGQVTDGWLTQCDRKVHSDALCTVPGSLRGLLTLIPRCAPNLAEGLGSEASTRNAKDAEAEVEDTPFPFVDQTYATSSFQEVAELHFILQVSHYLTPVDANIPP